MTQKDIANLIMNRFKETNSRANHVIDQRWILHGLLNKLNPKEQELLNPAISDLVDSDLISIDERAGGQCLVLTETAFDYIYPINEQQVIEKIQNAILAEFRKTNSRVNHVLQGRWISQTLIPSLNPKEQELVDKAINEIIDKELISFENRSGMDCLVLQQKGFDLIYE